MVCQCWWFGCDTCAVVVFVVVCIKQRKKKRLIATADNLAYGLNQDVKLGDNAAYGVNPDVKLGGNIAYGANQEVKLSMNAAYNAREGRIKKQEYAYDYVAADEGDRHKATEENDYVYDYVATPDDSDVISTTPNEAYEVSSDVPTSTGHILC